MRNLLHTCKILVFSQLGIINLKNESSTLLKTRTSDCVNGGESESARERGAARPRVCCHARRGLSRPGELNLLHTLGFEGLGVED